MLLLLRALANLPEKKPWTAGPWQALARDRAPTREGVVRKELDKTGHASQAHWQGNGGRKTPSEPLGRQEVHFPCGHEIWVDSCERDFLFLHHTLHGFEPALPDLRQRLRAQRHRRLEEAILGQDCACLLSHHLPKERHQLRLVVGIDTGCLRLLWRN